MYWLYTILGVTIIIQIALFIIGRKIRKREKENNILEKYDIRTRQEAWKLMGDMSIPEEDREKIRRIYEADDESE